MEAEKKKPPLACFGVKLELFPGKELLLVLLPLLEEGSEQRCCSLLAAQAASSASSLSARSNLSPSFPFSLLPSCSDLLLSSPGARRKAAGGEQGEGWEEESTVRKVKEKRERKCSFFSP